MSTFAAQITTAFGLAEVLQHGRILEGDLVEAESDNDTLWGIVHFLEAVGNSVWVPRLLTVPDQKRLESLFNDVRLQVHRDHLAPREESVSLITEGVATDLRSRVADAISQMGMDSQGHYDSFNDFKLWEEVLREAAAEWTFRSVKPHFELRGCAQCGRWFEPQLANRGRFCGTDCRKRFNNARVSGRDDVKTFTCGGCDRQLNMDSFSGLHYEHEDDPVTALRIGPYRSHLNNLRCVECVQENNPEWARYIAPIVDAKERTA